MKQQEMLFALVSHLSAAEKKYFRAWANRRSGEKKYLVLFDALLSLETYSEKDLRNRLKGEKLLRQLPVAKNYLFANILRSLRQFNEGRTNETRIAAEIRNIELLHEKGLFPVALRKIDPLYQLALHHEKFGRALEILGLKRKLLRISGYKGVTSEDFRKILREEESVQQLYENLRQYDALSDEYFLLVARGADKKTLGLFLKDRLLRDEKQALSFKAKIFYHLIRARIFHSIGKLCESAAESSRHVALLESLPAGLFQTERYNYIVAAYNLLIVHTQLKQDRAFRLLLRKLRNLPLHSEKERITVFYTYITEIDHALMMKRYDEAVKLEKPIRDGLKKYGASINHQIETAFCFNLSCAFLFSEQYRDALRWINRIVQDPKPELRPDIHLAARIINIFVHAELGNTELLPGLAAEGIRYMSKFELTNPAEKFLLRDGYRELMKNSTPREKQTALLTLRKKLAAVQRKHRGQDPVYNYSDWLRHKTKQGK